MDHLSDQLVWTGGDRSGDLTVDNCYKAYINTWNLLIWSGWRINLLKWCDQLKITLFFWLACENRILTWDALLKKGWTGPGIYYLCKASSEDVSHLLIHCRFTTKVWSIISHFQNSDLVWYGQNIDECVENWLTIKGRSKALPLITRWYIWKERNRVVF